MTWRRYIALITSRNEAPARVWPESLFWRLPEIRVGVWADAAHPSMGDLLFRKIVKAAYIIKDIRRA
jgi:hypothetical protein